MKPFKVLTVPLIVLISFSLTGCSGGSGKKADSPVAEAVTRETTTEETQLSPAELGQKIGDIYIKAMTDLVSLLKERPAALEVKSEVEVMKEAYVQELYALGKKRESLDDSARSAVDSQIARKARILNDMPEFNAFNDLQQYYFQDRDFHKLIMSFNIITQYAAFDLLKKQEPEEAARLGIQ